MTWLDLTLETPAENLALDEALLDASEQDDGPEILRFWAPLQMFVVLGYGNRVATEADVPACQATGVPILRRISGGGAVVQAPGCLNYALVLRVAADPARGSICGANGHVLERHRAALERALLRPVAREGMTDLTVDGLKFSGNSQRRRQRFILFHGTFLLEMDLGLVARFLPLPSRQPAYRQGRPHADFLTNLRVPAERLKDCLREAWGAAQVHEEVPWHRLTELVNAQYAVAAWNQRR